MAKTSVAMGNFDGVHLAHRRIVESALRGKEQGLIPTAVLFKTHPGEELRQDHRYIMTADEREAALADAGIEQFYYMDFHEVRDLSPEQFFDSIIIGKLDAGQVSCGFNYTFGKGAAGNTAVLSALCERSGVQLSVTDKVDMFAGPISSTRIKQFISDGDIERANAMLGRAFSYTATVVDGKHMGRKLGFPTINQYLDSSLVVPRFGVYASSVEIDGTVYKGATNIGTSPTLPNKGFRSETYIHGFDGFLYGKTLTVRLNRFIRDERHFNCVEELRAQVNRDKEITKNI